jgi:hypothetical protein
MESFFSTVLSVVLVGFGLASVAYESLVFRRGRALLGRRRFYRRLAVGLSLITIGIMLQYGLSHGPSLEPLHQLYWWSVVFLLVLILVLLALWDVYDLLAIHLARQHFLRQMLRPPRSGPPNSAVSEKNTRTSDSNTSSC